MAHESETRGVARLEPQTPACLQVIYHLRQEMALAFAFQFVPAEEKREIAYLIITGLARGDSYCSRNKVGFEQTCMVCHMVCLMAGAAAR